MTIQRLFVFIFVVALFALAVRPTLDADFGWHLRTGEYILQHGIPHQDVFSFTASEHEWITHEWLADVLMALLYRAAGLPALMLAFAGVVALTFWLVYLRCAGRPYLAAFATVFGLMVTGGILGARPQMFNMLGLAAFVTVVEGVKDGRWGRRAFLWLPLLTVIWVNLHSGYLLGVVLLGVYVVGESAQRRFGPPVARGLGAGSVRWLAIVTLLCFGVAAFNPNGYRLWIYPFETLGSDVMQTHIQEWQSPDFHLPIFWPFGALLVLGVVSLVLSPELPTWTDLLLFLGTGVAALNSARNITIFAIVALPITTRYLWRALAGTRLQALLQRDVSPPEPSRVRSGLHWGIVGLVALAGVVRVVDVVQNNEAALNRQYPVAAVDFLEREGWDERRGFNDYNWGGYLIWRGLPVFVDGRADVYLDEFLNYYLQTFQAQPAWQEPLNDYDVAYVLMRRDAPLTVLLTESQAWREAYRDDVAQVFVRVE